MDNEYLINNQIKFLKYFMVAFAVLPIVLLLGVLFLHGANNELIKIFSYISTAVVVLCAFALLWLSALPKYYFYIKNNILYLPVSSFLKSSGEHLKFELTQIETTNIGPSVENGYDLTITVKYLNEIEPSNMALGHISVEKVGQNVIICISSLNKKDATKWANQLIA